MLRRWGISWLFWASLGLLAGIIGVIVGSMLRIYFPIPDNRVLILNQLPEKCSVGSRVLIQDASETKAGKDRVTLYQCVQEKPRWEVQ